MLAAPGGKAAHGEGAVGGFPSCRGGGYGGPPPEKIENLHALRCILVHFQDQKVIFRSLSFS